MNFDRRALCALIGACLLASCTPTDVTLGNSVRQTMAAQIVDPDPQYQHSVPVTDAAKTSAAVKRYRTDAVKKPDSIRTTDTEAGGPN